MQKRFGDLKQSPYLCNAFEREHNKFGPWCNGSTTVFGTVCLGSNPGGPTKRKTLRRFLRSVFYFYENSVSFRWFYN